MTLYYAIKVNDTVFYTYYDQNYLQYKTSILLSNMHNINGNYAWKKFSEEKEFISLKLIILKIIK